MATNGRMVPPVVVSQKKASLLGPGCLLRCRSFSKLVTFFNCTAKRPSPTSPFPKKKTYIKKNWKMAHIIQALKFETTPTQRTHGSTFLSPPPLFVAEFHISFRDKQKRRRKSEANRFSSIIDLDSLSRKGIFFPTRRFFVFFIHRSLLPLSGADFSLFFWPGKKRLSEIRQEGRRGWTFCLVDKAAVALNSSFQHLSSLVRGTEPLIDLLCSLDFSSLPYPSDS